MATTAAAPGGTPAAAPPTALTRGGAVRVDAVDLLRGLVIAIMVLDHVRDYFHYDAFRFDPTDPARTTAALFATRWVTHLCAPTFVFLAGVSIWFQRANGKGGAALSGFLLKRGLWLVALEVTVVSFGFNFGPPFVFLQVIWAIGMSMVCMAALARLPSQAVLAVGAAICALHPLFAAATADASGALAVLRSLTLVPGYFAEAKVLAFYAFVPWLGVMCLGFGLGPLFGSDPARRRRAILLIAPSMLALFLLLRWLDGYGDPVPWQPMDSSLRTLFSFLNVSKYPPSPDYVLVTLGVSLLLFLALEHLGGPLARWLLTFGRTPLFTYVAHIYLMHGLMLVTAVATGFPALVAFDVFPTSFLASAPRLVTIEWGFSLGVVYLVWLTVLVLLYPLSRWFERVKRSRRDWWLSYL